MDVIGHTFPTRKLKCKDLMTNLPEGQSHGQISRFTLTALEIHHGLFSKKGSEIFASSYSSLPHELKVTRNTMGRPGAAYSFQVLTSLDSIIHTEVPVKSGNNIFLTGLNPVNMPT